MPENFTPASTAPRPGQSPVVRELESGPGERVPTRYDSVPPTTPLAAGYEGLIRFRRASPPSLPGIGPERAACTACYEANVADPLQCAAAVDSYEACSRRAAEAFINSKS